MIGEDQGKANHQKSIAYNEFLGALAKEKHYLLADLNADMQAAVAKANTPGQNAITSDGVHMAFPGDMMMATGILKTIGLDEKELAKAWEAWLEFQYHLPLAQSRPHPKGNVATGKSRRRSQHHGSENGG